MKGLDTNFLLRLLLDDDAGMRNRAAGCETTLTFDKRASRMADFTLVRSEAV